MNLGWDIIEIFTGKKWRAFKEEGCDVYFLPDEERDKWLDKCKHIWLDVAKKIGPVGEQALDIYFKVNPDRKP